MMTGLLLKSLREIRGLIVIFAVALGIAEGLLSYVIPQLLSTYGSQLLQMEFVQRIIAGLMGMPLAGGVTEVMYEAFPWVHPVVISLLWIGALWLGTRLPAGEIDRGTADILLSLPVSRAAVLVSDTISTLIAGGLMASAAAAGHVIGYRLSGTGPAIPIGVTAAIASNLFALFVAVLGLAYLGSGVADKRGRAVGATVTVVVASYFLSFLVEFWPRVRSVEFLGIMTYFRPVPVIQEQAWPIRDMGILLSFGVICWSVGLVVFSYRDIRNS